jgi:arylsulfatase A-like enzyme
MPNANRPHILYILSDEHRGQAMSHLGDPNVRTPWMDRLAREGASFRRAYANCPICTPSRGTIFSGRHAHAGPVAGFFDVYKAAAPSIATELRAAGYHTAYFGKWHCGMYWDQRPRRDVLNWAIEGQPNRTPEHHRAGFQDWYGFEINNHPFDGQYWHQSEFTMRPLPGYQTDALTDLVIDYLRRYDSEAPLFLTLSIEPPHFPLDAPEEFKQRFDPDNLELRPNFVDTPDHRQKLALYYAMIENLDWNIGRLMEALASMPRFRNTLTVYFSDHGDFMGSHGRACGKDHPHEESVRIPAIFHWPGRIPLQGTVDGLFSLVDLMPTTLGLAGVSVPAWNQGIDWSPHLLGQEFSKPQDVLLEMVNSPRWHLEMPDWRGLVTEQYKYAHFETGQEILFDLASDPYEQHDIATSSPELCRHFRERLLTVLADTREPFFDVLIQYPAPPPRMIGDLARGTFRSLESIIPPTS